MGCKDIFFKGIHPFFHLSVYLKRGQRGPLRKKGLGNYFEEVFKFNSRRGGDGERREGEGGGEG